MKKTSILLISFALVMLFASSAFAAQASYFGPNGTNTNTYYSSTTVSTISQTYSATSDKLPRLTADNKFKADGTTHYPYEIYLPNESNPAQYRIHSNYTRSTDACASCHATHTAVGPSLLQWYSVYETCIACHDGTVTTTYNVVEGKIGEAGYAAYGGMFGIGNEKSLSSHNVTGAVDISAAPGGSVREDITVDKGYGVTTTVWQAEFTCSSCHTPHGQGGNARILNPDPNGYASLKNHKTNLTINATGDILNGATKVPVITGYPYKVIIKDLIGNDISDNYLVRNDRGGNEFGVNSYLVAKGSALLTSVATVEAIIPYQVRMQIDNYLNDGGREEVRHIAGINDYCGACHVDYNTEPSVKEPAGNGVEKIMRDSTKRPGSINTGEYSKAHRHAVGLKWNYAGAADKGYIGWSAKPMMTVGYLAYGTNTENGNEGFSSATLDPNDKDTYISCLTCHFAHGTSEDFWLTWLNDGAFAGNYSTWTAAETHEISGSSALKRLPNMGTCEACHQKGPDNQGYAANSGSVSSQVYDVTDGIFAPGDYSSLNPITNAQCTNGICHQHDKMLAPYNGTKMAVDSDGNGADYVVNCTDCHGNAGNHVIQPSADNIVNPRNLTVAEQTAKCTTCHTGAKAVGGTNWTAHEATGVVSCTTCHDSHKQNSIENTPLKREYDALCASCHDTTFAKPVGNFHQ